MNKLRSFLGIIYYVYTMVYSHQICPLICHHYVSHYKNHYSQLEKETLAVVYAVGKLFIIMVTCMQLQLLVICEWIGKMPKAMPVVSVDVIAS